MHNGVDVAEGRIFISYRRGVDSHVTGRLHDRLALGFDRDQLFMDVDAIPPGRDFVDHLAQHVARCRAFLAVIGPGWIDAMARLQDPNDFVRIEIEAALARPDLAIVPVLIDGTRMPAGSDLPVSLAPFVRRAGVSLPHEHFAAVVDGRLAKALRLALAAPPIPLERQNPGDGLPPPDQLKPAQRPESMAPPAGNPADQTVPSQSADPGSAGTGARQNRRNGQNELWWPFRPTALAAAALLTGVVLWILHAAFSTPGEPAKTEHHGAALASRTNATQPKPGQAGNREALSTFTECPECPVMVVLPSGVFTMGSPAHEPGRRDSEGPQRVVTIPSFALARTEITFDQWQACADGGGCASNPAPDDGGWGRGARPVIHVSWTDAQEYVAWLNTTVPGTPYRLPSEAEWEYAARAATEAAWTVDAAKAELTAHAWYRANANRTQPVGQKRANAFGLYDLHGNVWEWTQDCWHLTFQGAPTNGSAWMAGDGGDCALAVRRGGGWADQSSGIRAAVRDWSWRRDRIDIVGLRVARSLGP